MRRVWLHEHGTARGRPDGRSQQGVILVELAFVIPILAMVVFTALDYGRVAKYQNRLANSAREGAALAQYAPLSVNTGCNGDRNIVDRVKAQNSDIATNAGFSVTVYKKNTSTGALTAYTGCNAASNGVTIAPGDRIVVKVTATMTMTAPLSVKALGQTATVTRQVEVVAAG